MSTLVIEELDDASIRDLGALAAANRTSVEAQARQLLRRSVPGFDRSRRAAIADAIAKSTPPGLIQSDSVELLRVDRQR